MDTIYLGILIGVASPIVLALSAKALKRVPQDLKNFLGSIAGFIRN